MAKELTLYRFQIQDRHSKEWFIKNIYETNYEKAKEQVKQMYIECHFLVLPLMM